MRFLLALLMGLCCATAHAADPDLLDRALACRLASRDLPTLMAKLAPTLGKPAAQYGAPTANVYRLANARTAHGYSASEIVVAPTRILIAVPDHSVADAAKRLKLESAPFSPASRELRKDAAIVAFQLSHQQLAGKLLVGCEYRDAGAATWPERN